MKRICLTVAIFCVGCVSDPDVVSVDSENISIYGDWIYQGESRGDVEFRAYVKDKVITIDNSCFNMAGESKSYTLDKTSNMLLFEDGAKYTIEELTSSKMILNDGTTIVILSR